jgi:hypothetical protein
MNVAHAPKSSARAINISLPRIVRTSRPRLNVCLATMAATADNQGDQAWNKTYYPKLADTNKVEKEWCVLTLGSAMVLVLRTQLRCSHVTNTRCLRLHLAAASASLLLYFCICLPSCEVPHDIVGR